MDYTAKLSDLLALGQADAACPDQRCLLSVMERHGSGLVQMLWRVLGNQADVADAYQETFCRLTVLLHDGKSWNTKGFVYRMAANIAIDILRRRRRYTGGERDFDQVAARENLSPAAACVQRDEQDRLREAIADLPDYLRNVLVLKEFGELDYAAVGAALQISPATARQYRHRAVMMLTQKLQGQKER